jgi:regulator of sirC expression with transglutaminase-like and TPR domain
MGERVFVGGAVPGTFSQHLVLVHSEHDYFVTELSRIAADMKSSWSPELTVKKYRALLEQASKLNLPDSPRERLFCLQHFFFNERGFSVLASKPSLDKCLLPYTLLSRSGPPEVLLLLFLSLAKNLNLQVEVLQGPTLWIVKLLDSGKAYLFEFNSTFREYSKAEIVDMVNAGCDFTRSVNAKTLLTSYLSLLKTQSLRERSLVQFYKLQSHLIHHQPFALQHLVDRARAAYAIGDLVRAAEDLGQYMTFRSEKVTNSRYAKLLRKMKARHF